MDTHPYSTAEICYKRVPIVYSEDDKAHIDLLRGDIAEEIKELKDTKQSPIYPSQAHAAKGICSTFEIPHVSLILAIAPTQAGKTGTMLGVLDEFYGGNTSLHAPHPDNVWVITALSDMEWKRQTRLRMPPSIRDHVIHLPDIKKDFASKLADMKNGLIIIDEAQIGCKINQTIHKVFQKAGILDIEQITQRNIRILMFTATPSGLKLESHTWGNNHRSFYIEPDNSYISSNALLEKGQLKQVKNISGVDNNGKLTISLDELHKNVSEVTDAIISFDSPRYHIIRVHKGLQGVAAIENIISSLNKTGVQLDYCAYFHNPKTRKQSSSTRSYDTKLVKSILKDINDVLCRRPAKPTIIFIKDRIRCAKTLIKKHLGVEYERHVTCVNDEVNIQSIRATGYDTHKDIIVFADTNSVKRYDALCKTQFEDYSLMWNSSTMTFSERMQIQETKPTFLRTLKAGNEESPITETGKTQWDKIIDIH